jgi:hypothetical protein
MRIEEGRSMKDIIVRLDINYQQHYEPSGSRNGMVLAIGLSYRSDLAIREVDPQAAPVAYRVKGMTGLLSQCSELVAGTRLEASTAPCGGRWWAMKDC